MSGGRGEVLLMGRRRLECAGVLLLVLLLLLILDLPILLPRLVGVRVLCVRVELLHMSRVLRWRSGVDGVDSFLLLEVLTNSSVLHLHDRGSPSSYHSRGSRGGLPSRPLRLRSSLRERDRREEARVDLNLLMLGVIGLVALVRGVKLLVNSFALGRERGGR